ncbi:hypothetical protein BGW80DRAFT_1561980 [Lactifluus volemus]|nr:hypothetical protein BGW80DRAFT_1561980 [Lactifluus volemus]
MRHQKARISQKRPDPTSFPRVTIGSLPDNVLLDIFNIYRTSWNIPPSYPWWHVLVHVCGKWTYIVFQSPLRLHLQLECNVNTPVKKTLDVWLRALPIVIVESRSRLPLSGANIIAALEQHDRYCVEATQQSDEEAISSFDISPPEKYFKFEVGTGASRYLFGWICPASPASRLGRYSISGTTKIASILP